MRQYSLSSCSPIPTIPQAVRGMAADSPWRGFMAPQGTPRPGTSTSAVARSAPLDVVLNNGGELRGVLLSCVGVRDM